MSSLFILPPPAPPVLESGPTPVASKTPSPPPFVAKNFFPRPEIEKIAADQDRFYLGQADSRPPFSWPAPRPISGSSRKHPYASFFIPSLAKLLRDGRLANLVANYAGFQKVRSWHDQLLYEKPSSRPKNPHWHTERSRWMTCHTTLMVTAWIPLCDFTPEMGPITLVPNATPHSPILPKNYRPNPADCQPITLRAGDLVLFPWEMIHGNPANLSSQPRRAVAAHFAPEKITYRPHLNFSHVNERLVRPLHGQPNFQDEKVCPLIR